MNQLDAKAEYAEAKRLHAAGHHAEALARLDALDAAFPDSKNVLLARAECLLALGDAQQARKFCERVIARQDDARARRILDLCEQPSPIPLAPSAATPSGPPPLPRRKTLRRLLISISILTLMGVGAIVVALRFVQQQNGPRQVASAYTKNEIAQAVGARQLQRAAAEKQARATADAAAAEARRQPGYVIPESEWGLDPATGAPKWRPGIYRQLPCPGTSFTKSRAPRTLDLYLPMAYDVFPNESFPTLVISMPFTDPGFRGYEKWAEKRHVILIVINSSCNDCGTQSNREAQLAAYNFLSASGLRGHPQLNFATGMSGGAQMSWILAANSPDMFKGLLMVAHGGFREVPLAPHIRVAFVNGKDDWNAEYVIEMMNRLHANGNEMRHQVVEGGHVEGPQDVRERMLDWLLESARRDLRNAPQAGESGTN